MQNEVPQKDTAAWIFQVWASFIVSLGATCLGVAYLPVEPWVRAFMALGILFSVASSLSLAKTIRDNHEARRLLARLTDAKAEKLIREFELGEDSGARAAAR